MKPLAIAATLAALAVGAGNAQAFGPPYAIGEGSHPRIGSGPEPLLVAGPAPSWTAFTGVSTAPLKPLATAGEAVTIPSLAVHEGHAVTAYFHSLSEGDLPELAVSYHAPGGGFETPYVIDRDAMGDTQLDLSPHIGEDGRALVAWLDRPSRLAVSSRAPGGRFGAQAVLARRVSPRAWDVALTPGGAAAAVWVRRLRRGASVVETRARASAKGRFGRVHELARYRGRAVGARVHLDDAGRATFAWVPPRRRSIVVADGRDGARRRVSAPGAAIGNDLALAGNGRGDLALAWIRMQGQLTFDGGDLLVALRPRGARFGTPATVTAGGTEAVEPDLEVDDNGNVLVAYNGGVPGGTQSTGQRQAQAALGNVATTVGEPSTLSDQGVDFNYGVDGAFVRAGEAIVAWSEHSADFREENVFVSLGPPLPAP